MILKFLAKKKDTIRISKSEYEELLNNTREINELKVKLESFESQLKDNSSSSEELNSKVEEYNTYFEILEEEVSNQQNEIISFDNQVHNIVKRVIEVAENAKHENSIVDETFSILCETTNNINDMSEAIKNMFENISSLSEFVKRGTDQVNMYKKQMDIVCKSLENFKESYSLLKKEITNLSNNNRQIKSISSKTKLVALNALVQSASADKSRFSGQSVINRELQKLSESAIITSKDNDTATSRINNEIMKFSYDIDKLFIVVYKTFELITSSLMVFNQLEASNKKLNDDTDVVKSLLESTNESVIKMISSVENVRDAVEKNYINAIEVSKLTEQQTGATTNMTAICQNMLGLIKRE
ncbi:methyl-accepting chemotaxis protein [Pseudobacteroides cellulosolvens]|uniref:Putative methyl-accepting chemotaxis sensory transducer n=1 Tax=Pseudobacteroides cellulosolvens ATCC 35603 = DSM 2933 TaxID=398512 RepID=A0A0L6JU30_9FIRM|nr:methyl-accepting chemotaxis protein [Pseudobacteroides cellulosolvens]KNY29180.1 putative methyl-accepting chemotaxis sensory transducer [Pseudobacteroides cellulosolvens ATCC 35603 = DSM 2933]